MHIWKSEEKDRKSEVYYFSCSPQRVCCVSLRLVSSGALARSICASFSTIAVTKNRTFVADDLHFNLSFLFGAKPQILVACFTKLWFESWLFSETESQIGTCRRTVTVYPRKDAVVQFESSLWICTSIGNEAFCFDLPVQLIALLILSIRLAVVSIGGRFVFYCVPSLPSWTRIRCFAGDWKIFQVQLQKMNHSEQLKWIELILRHSHVHIPGGRVTSLYRSFSSHSQLDWLWLKLCATFKFVLRCAFSCYCVRNRNGLLVLACAPLMR